MTPDNDPDFDSDPVATRYTAMGPGQEPEPGKSVNRKMKDAGKTTDFYAMNKSKPCRLWSQHRAARLCALGVQIDSASLDCSLERLTLGFVLGRGQARDYFYRAPLFRENLMADDLEQRLAGEVECWRG